MKIKIIKILTLTLLASSFIVSQLEAQSAVNFYWPPTNAPGTTLVNTGFPIPFTNTVFSANGDRAAYPIIDGINGSSAVHIQNPGTYLISYHAASNLLTEYSVGLRLTSPAGSQNTSFIPGSVIRANNTVPASGVPLFNVNGQVIFNHPSGISEGVTIELVNSSFVGPIALVAFSTSAGTTGTTEVPIGTSSAAFLNIVQLD